MLIATGDFSRARESFLSWRETDPLDAIVRAFLCCLNCSTALGDEAFAEYERGKAIYGHWVLADRFMLWQRLAAERSIRLTRSTYPVPINAAARAHFDAPDEALAALRDLYADDANDDLRRGRDRRLGRALRRSAFRVRSDARGDREQFTELLRDCGVPVMAPVRRLPEFKSLVREVGLPEYWNEFGWPEICRQLGGDDFECD